jgi:hypothetical protein
MELTKEMVIDAAHEAGISILHGKFERQWADFIDRLNQYRAPAPAQQPETQRAALQALIMNWREYNPHPSTPISKTLHRCASELEAVLSTELAHTSPAPPRCERENWCVLPPGHTSDCANAHSGVMGLPAAAPESAEPSTPLLEQIHHAEALLALMGDRNHLAKVRPINGDWSVVVVADRASVQEELTKLRLALAARSEAPAAPKEGKTREVWLEQILIELIHERDTELDMMLCRYKFGTPEYEIWQEGVKETWARLDVAKRDARVKLRALGPLKTRGNP